MQHGAAQEEGEAAWRRVASHLETEVSRLQKLLEQATSANRELESQSNRLAKLEMERGIFNAGAPGVGVGNRAEEQQLPPSIAALSPALTSPAYDPQHRGQGLASEAMYLPRPHSRCSSPVVLPVSAPPPPPIPQLPSAGMGPGGGARSMQQQQQQRAHQQEIESLKGQVAWHERERAKVQQQVNRLYDELEGARGEVTHLRHELQQKEAARARHEKALAGVRDAARESQEGLESLQAERDQLVARLRAGEKERTEMRQHITKLDMYLVNMARELDESRDSRAELTERVKQLSGQLERREEQVSELSQDLQALSKWVTRTQGTKKSFDRALDSLQRLADRFKATGMEEGTMAMCRQLSSGVQAATPEYVEGLSVSLRKLSSDARAIAVELLEEVAAGKRESEYISNDLNDLTSQLRKATVKLQQVQGDKPQQPAAAAAPLTERLRALDEGADETSQRLRDLMRARVSHMQGLVRAAHEGQADVLAENERLQREAREAADRIATLESEVSRLQAEVEALTARVASLSDKERTAEGVVQLQESELGELRPKICQAEREAESLKEVVEQLRATLSEVMVNKGRVEAELSEMRDLACARETDLEAARDENATLLDRVTGLTEVVESARHREEEAAEKVEARAEEVEALTAALEEETWRRERLEDLLGRRRAKGDAAAVLRAWAQVARRAAARRWRLCVMFKSTALLREEQAEAQRLAAEVQDLSLRLEQSGESGDTWRARAIELEGQVDVLQERAGEVLGGLKRRAGAAAVLRAWARAVREAAQRRRDFRQGFTHYVLGKRLRHAKAAGEELEARLTSQGEELATLTATLELWSRKGADPERRSELEAQVEAGEARGRELLEQVELLQGKAREQEQRIKAVEGERDEGEAERRALSLQVQTLEAGLKAAREEVEEKRGLQADLAARKAASVVLEAELKRSQDEADDKGRQLEEASRRLGEAEQKLSLREQEVRRLQQSQASERALAELTRLEQEKAAAVAAQRKAEQEAERLRQERARAAARHREVEQVLQATREEYVRLQDALPRVEEQLAEARDALSRSHGLPPPAPTAHREGEEAGRGRLSLSPASMMSEVSDPMGGGARLPIFSAYGAEPEESRSDALSLPGPTAAPQCSSCLRPVSRGPSEVVELGARLMRAEADKADLSRKLEDARREVMRLWEEVEGMIESLRREGLEEQDLRQRVAELEREVSERRREAEELVREAASDGQQDIDRLQEEMAAEGGGHEEQQAEWLTRELERVHVSNRQLLETIQRQREEIDRLEADSRDAAIQQLRSKLAALGEENERLRRIALASPTRRAGGVTSPQAARTPSSQNVIRALSAPADEAEVASLRRALEVSEQERWRLQEQLRAVTQERDEFQQLCQVLRDEMLGMAEHSPQAARGRSPGIDGAGAHQGRRDQHSPEQLDGYRRRLQVKEEEIEQLRRELERELRLRRELEDEGERARREREERAELVSQELGEAKRQRDQASHTAHNLETALRRSQERIDYLIRENSSIKHGLTALEKRISHYSTSSSSRKASSRRPDGAKRLLVDAEDSSTDDTSRRAHSLSMEPEWSPSSNAAMRSGNAFEDDDLDDVDRRKHRGNQASHRREASDLTEDEEPSQRYELEGSHGGRAFLVTGTPRTNGRNGGRKDKKASTTSEAPGEGARLEVLRMLHTAEMELQGAVRRRLPVDPALKEYIHELKDALQKLEDADSGTAAANRQQQYRR